MASYQYLPSGSWRAQVRKHGVYNAYTFERKRDAVQWATEIEAASGPYCHARRSEAFSCACKRITRLRPTQQSSAAGRS